MRNDFARMHNDYLDPDSLLYGDQEEQEQPPLKQQKEIDRLWKEAKKVRQKIIASLRSMKIPSPEECIASMGGELAVGDFNWEPEAGDWHCYYDDGVWDQVAYSYGIKREGKKITFERNACDKDGNWDCIDGWETGDTTEQWEWFYRSTVDESNEYFYGWVEYDLWVAEKREDPLHTWLSGVPSVDECIVSAKDNLKYLKMGLPKRRTSGKRVRKVR